jgi:hypothetical protein
VFEHYYTRSLFSRQSFPLHLAFAFTDSTGVWGAARVRPPSGMAASHVQLCVGKESFQYRIDDRNEPKVDCPNRRLNLSVLIPASIDWEPSKGKPYQELGGYGEPMRFTVALSSADRAIPLGPRGPTPPITRNEQDLNDFHDLLMSATKARSWQQETHQPNDTTEPKPSYRSVSICAQDSVVYKGSLTGLQTPRAIAITNAIRAYLSANASGPLRFEIEEPHGTPEILGLIGEPGDCADAGQHEYQIQSPEGWAVPSSTVAHDQFVSLLKEVMQASGAPIPRRSSGPRYILGICISKPNADVPSWGGPQSARANVFRSALRQFVSSHQFADGDLLPMVRVTAAGNAFAFQEQSTPCPSEQLYFVDTHAEKPK